jgi:hypothetical protein
MTAPSSRPSPDPIRQHLIDVRRGLLRLHKRLVDSERAVLERRTGPMSNGQFLQALIQDPALAWLRPHSTLIVEIDEALAAREGVAAADARAYIDRVGALVDPAEGSEEVALLTAAQQRDPDVLLAHLELTRRVADARES